MARLPAALLVLATLATPASADVFRLFGELHGGAMGGQGTSGDAKASDFFAKSPNGTYGALIGAELLFADLWIQHHQYVGNGHLTTWTQFGLGVHFNFDLGDAKQRKAHLGNYVEMGAGLWFGIGTGAQVQPPLDNAQLTDKAFLAEARVGFGRHLNKVFDIGLEVPASYGFYFKSGNGAGANNTSNQYEGWMLEGLVALRANLRIP